MENIKFIRKFAAEIPRECREIGDCVYFDLKNGNVVKAYCEEDGVRIEVINAKEGRVDIVKLAFRRYFQFVQCSPGAPLWCQHIEHGKWSFEGVYSHTLPKKRDYQNLAEAMENYISMFE